MRAAEVLLRPVEAGDLDTLYAHRCDPQAMQMAMVKARERAAFLAQWEAILCDGAVVPRAIVADGQLVGSLSVFQMDGVDAVGYWIGREHWGRGIATRALGLLLAEVARRPLHARVAASNAGSIRVLERCGFVYQRSVMSPETGHYLACEEAEYRLG